MSFKIVFIHTVPSLIGLFDDLSREFLPVDSQVFHIADETLLEITLTAKRLTPFIFRRVAEHAIAANELGVDLIQLTCSSISPTAEIAKRMVNVPVLKIDEPMIDHALQFSRRIGVVATAPTTLKPTQEQIYERAKLINISVTVESLLCEEAYTALFNGNRETHDQIVKESVQQLMDTNDVVILAQASMACVAEKLSVAELKVPVLSSPRLAMERIRGLLLNGVKKTE